jgi:hypothetical protein
MPNASDQSYKHRLGAVLRRRDPVQLQLFLRAGAAAYGDDQQVRDVDSRGIEEIEELMYRMILARPDLSDLHAESRARLAARGMGAPTLDQARAVRGRRRRNRS